METMVAAHRTLPFQTRLLVRNLTNGKTVEVRIIDRGPFVGSRIIDLSHAAARQIDLIGPGIAEVELSLAEATVAPAVSFFGVQIGAFQDRANAERNAAAMRQIYGAALIVERPGEPILFRVLAGKEPAQDLAEALAGRIRREQNTPQAFVVRLDQ
jgi:rare lipoprotein A